MEVGDDTEWLAASLTLQTHMTLVVYGILLRYQGTRIVSLRMSN